MIAKFLLALLMFFAVAVLGAKQPIGIRADNPGNIHGTNWRAWEFNPIVIKELRQGVRSWTRILVQYSRGHDIRSPLHTKQL